MIEVRELPAPDDGKGRVETGVTQFGDDWPGIFIRGDNAFGYMLSLRAMLDCPPDAPDNTAIALYRWQVKGLADLLESCDVHKIRESRNP